MITLRVIDFETTGLPPYAGIVEVGWTDVFVDATTSVERMWHAELTNPGMPIQIEAQAIHHISNEDVKDCRHSKEVLEELSECDAFVAHNMKFEKQFFKGAGKPWICTLKTSREMITDSPGHSNQVLRYHLRLDSIPGFSSKAMPPHRAGPDTWVSAHVLCKLLEKKPWQELATQSEQVVLLETCNFGKKHYGKLWSQVPKDYLQWMLSNIPNLDEDTLHTVKYHLGIVDP